MRIILAPAKKMNEDVDSLPWEDLPCFLEQADILRRQLKELTLEQMQALFGCNRSIAELNYERYQTMDLKRRLTPAILAYEGIAYRYMAPSVFENGEFSYVQEHLRILSGFYGVLRPMDGVVPYRLEMQAKLSVNGAKDLYEFWGRALYDEVRDDGLVINLASKEYSRCIETWLTPNDTCLTCVFGECSGGKVIQKGTYAKMARGEMVRYMAEQKIEDPEQLKSFDRLKYHYAPEWSSAEEYVFLRN